MTLQIKYLKYKIWFDLLSLLLLVILAKYILSCNIAYSQGINDMELDPFISDLKRYYETGDISHGLNDTKQFDKYKFAVDYLRAKQLHNKSTCLEQEYFQLKTVLYSNYPKSIGTYNNNTYFAMTDIKDKIIPNVFYNNIYNMAEGLSYFNNSKTRNLTINALLFIDNCAALSFVEGKPLYDLHTNILSPDFADKIEILLLKIKYASPTSHTDLYQTLVFSRLEQLAVYCKEPLLKHVISYFNARTLDPKTGGIIIDPTIYWEFFNIVSNPKRYASLIDDNTIALINELKKKYE